MNYVASIRVRRQITLPREMLEKLAVSVGDRLVFRVKDGQLTVKPVQVQSLDTIKEIQTAFKKSKVTEKELLLSGEEVRGELAKKTYG